MKKPTNVKTIETTISAIQGGYLKLTTVVETAQNLIEIFNCNPEEKDQVAQFVENKLKAMMIDDNSFISASKDLGELKLYKDINERTKIISYNLFGREISARPGHFLDSPQDIEAMKKMDEAMRKFAKQKRKRNPIDNKKYYKKAI